MFPLMLPSGPQIGSLLLSGPRIEVLPPLFSLPAEYLLFSGPRARAFFLSSTFSSGTFLPLALLSSAFFLSGVSLWARSRSTLLTLCLSLSFSSRRTSRVPAWHIRSSSRSFLIVSSSRLILASIVVGSSPIWFC